MSAKLKTVPALLAVSSFLVPTAQAAPMPTPSASLEVVAQMGAGSDYHRYYRYRRGPSVGDVLTGVLIVGTIAAATKAMRGDRYRERDYPQRYPRRGDERYDQRRYDDARGIDRAVEMCLDAVEREGRVETVDRVDRTAAGWRVSGAMRGGKSFACTLGEDGRMEQVEVEGRRIGRDARWQGRDSERDDDQSWRDGDVEDRQYEDDRYARAWLDRENRGDVDDDEDGSEVPVMAEGSQPSYPGGPLPGEEQQDAPAVSET